MKVFLVMALVAFSSAIVLAAPAKSANMAASVNTITVSGTGEIKVDPDVVYIDMGVVTHAKTVALAQGENAKQIQQVYQVFSSRYALTQKDVRTTAYNITPDYETTTVNNVSTSVLVGYTVRNSVRVTLRDLTKLGNLIDEAGSAGANEMNTITFGTEKQKEYELKALAIAMADARSKAEVMAKSESRKVLRVAKVTQNEYSRQPQYAAARAAGASADTMISSGQLTISATVNVDYEF